MAEPRQPQDRKPKQEKSPEEFFTFTAGGRQHTMPNRTMDVLTPNYHRLHRKMDDEDRLWTMLEDLAEGDDEVLSSFGELSTAEWRQLQRDFAKHAGTPGE